MKELTPLKVVFNLDGTGVYMDPNDPLHLDALIAWALAPFVVKNKFFGRDDQPEDIHLPLGRWYADGEWGWHASALFPDDGAVESLQHWRKKFRQNRVEICKGNPNLQNGPYREYNVPMPLVNCLTMTAYALGNSKVIKKLLRRQVRYLGKKKAYGKGRIVAIDVEEIDADLSLVCDGMAQRYLPDPGGSRLVRPRPPYWNNVGKIRCCNVGEPFQWES